MRREPSPADRPTLRVDLGAVARNWQAARRAFLGARLGAVLKYDAYGLGMAQVAPVIAAAGCRDFWLAHGEEGEALRTILPEGEAPRVFVLNGLAGHDPADLFARAIIPVLTHIGEVDAAAAHARRAGTPQRVAIHLDTGLTRVGLQEGDIATLVADPHRLAGLRIEAWVTQLGHFDDLSCAESLEQRDRFDRWTAQLPRAERSLATSTGAFGDPGWHFDHARIGSALYGVQAGRVPYPVTCAASLSATVLRVVEVPAGVEVGYGSAFRTRRPSRLATIAMGYGDGLPFSRATSAMVSFGGRLAPLVGTPSMALVTADVTDLPGGQVKPGDSAEFYGASQDVESLARALGVATNALLVPTARLAHRVWSAP